MLYNAYEVQRAMLSGASSVASVWAEILNNPRNPWGYAGFAPLYESQGGQAAAMTEVACWAHVRRKIYDVHLATKAPIAAEALERIGRLFDVEREVNGLAPEARRKIRQARARPVIDELAAFLEGSLPKLSGKGELAGAMRYARGRWEALTRYLAGRL